MTPSEVRKLKVNDEIAVGGLFGLVTCVDLTDDDKIVVKWDCCESEDVLCETSPLWFSVHSL